MRQIQKSCSVATFREDMIYTEAALSANPETASMADPFYSEIERSEEMSRKEREARQTLIRAAALLAVQNLFIDNITAGFGGALLVECQQNRQAPLFLRFFSKAPSEIVRLPLRRQCEHTLNIMVPELEKLGANHSLYSYHDPLREAATKALAALDQRNKARAEQSMNSAVVDEWKEGVNQLRLSTYAALLAYAADHGYRRSWPNVFFPATAARKTEPATEDTSLPVDEEKNPA